MEESKAKDQKTKMRRSRSIGTIILDFLPIISALPIVIFAFPPKNLFDFHPLLVTLAVMALVPFGIRILDKGAPILSQSPRSQKMKWHWMIHSMAVLLLFVGVSAVYVSKAKMNKPHYTTWHGLLGLFTVIIALLQALGGFGFYCNTWPFRRRISYSRSSKLHAFNGVLFVLLATAAVVLGLYSNWFDWKLSNMAGNGFKGTLVMMYTVVICSAALRILMQVLHTSSPKIPVKPE
ncbi:unnamed protein product [Calicophoron daubneyi]|uniref:ascorbate ferrireductase (transmembrane) n=1 Tax=Calicophoron daubneyi TaxID=300641 RepID=A0AAV2TYJ8_CALDB